MASRRAAYFLDAAPQFPRIASISASFADVLQQLHGNINTDLVVSCNSNLNSVRNFEDFWALSVFGTWSLDTVPRVTRTTLFESSVALLTPLLLHNNAFDDFQDLGGSFSTRLSTPKKQVLVIAAQLHIHHMMRELELMYLNSLLNLLHGHRDVPHEVIAESITSLLLSIALCNMLVTSLSCGVLPDSFLTSKTWVSLLAVFFLSSRPFGTCSAKPSADLPGSFIVASGEPATQSCARCSVLGCFRGFPRVHRLNSCSTHIFFGIDNSLPYEL